MDIQVKGCNGCSLLNTDLWRENSNFCNHPHAPIDCLIDETSLSTKNNPIYITPSWCPLKQESITIFMK